MRIESPSAIGEAYTGTLTPGQQCALLYLRRSYLSRIVVARLQASTIRAGANDYQALEQFHLAHRKADGFHELTPRGHFKANEVARDLAKEYGIETEPYKSPREIRAAKLGRKFRHVTFSTW